MKTLSIYELKTNPSLHAQFHLPPCVHFFLRAFADAFLSRLCFSCCSAGWSLVAVNNLSRRSDMRFTRLDGLGSIVVW